MAVNYKLILVSKTPKNRKPKGQINTVIIIKRYLLYHCTQSEFLHTLHALALQMQRFYYSLTEYIYSQNKCISFLYHSAIIERNLSTRKMRFFLWCRIARKFLRKGSHEIRVM